MAYCSVEDCLRPDEGGGICFYHKIRTLRWSKGQLVNRLHPGLTMKESQDKIVADAAKSGIEATPVQESTWT